MKIFTFWEPRERVPGYIRLCMETWAKALPDAEVVLLDFGNIGEYLPEDELRRINLMGCKKMTLAKQSDIFRCFLIERHGGIWLDADTIMTPAARATDVFERKAETTMFARTANGVRQHPGAFINAVPHARMLREWREELFRRVDVYRRYSGNPLLRLFNRGKWRKYRIWDYFVNAIIDPMSEKLTDGELHEIDLSTTRVFLHNHSEEVRDAGELERYVNYYFRPGVPEADKADSGLVMLFNSWTPPQYRQMSREEFLRQDIRMAAMFRELV